MDKFTCCWN